MAEYLEVFDAIMGSGKSTNILKWCDENPDNNFIYVTPLLTESEDRVVNACEVVKFIAPQADKNTKGANLLDLLKCGENVSVTHAMYSSLSDEHLKVIKEKEYILILDEEVEFISPLSSVYTHKDFDYLKKIKQITVSEVDGRVEWVGDSVAYDDTRYSLMANMCRLGMLYEAKREGGWFVTQLPMSLIYCAKRVVLLTYLFKGSILESFLKIKGVTVVPFKEVGVRKVDKQRIRDLIEFVGDRQVERWSGERMSTAWYKESSQATLTQLAKSIRAVGDSIKAKNVDVLWCAPSSYVKPKKGNSKKVSPSGFSAGKGLVAGDGCFLPCTTRATNIYKDRTVMIHCYNRFPQAAVEAYLQDYGATVDRDKFALAEFLQWLWRSAIRDDKPIKVCILPRRMRKLFQDWLAED